MHLGAATNLRRSLLVVIAVPLAACAAGAPAVERLSPEQLERCRAAEVAFRSGAADWPARRDELARDPVATAWLVRMFVHDLILEREGRPLGDDEELLRAAAKIENPVERAALHELRQLGAAAVPTLIADLLLHPQAQPRELGVELLAHIGAPAIGPLQQVARTGESRPRRAAARALGRIGPTGEVFATLRDLAGDSDYAVRADALRSLRGGGEEARRLLLAALAADPDPFVRRVAAQTLAEFPGADTASALIDYLERCKREQDWPGEQQAQASLQRLVGARGPRAPTAWRALVAAPAASEQLR
jgi:hypothetical protein